MAERTAEDVRFAGGAHVWTKRRGRWWSSVVLKRNRDGYRVRYDAWGPSADEDVSADRVAPGSRRAPGLRGNLALEIIAAALGVVMLFGLGLGVAIVRDGSESIPRTAPPDGSVVPSRDRLPREQAVWVERDGRWHPGVVLRAATTDVVLVHYSRHAAGDDEWVRFDRVRLR